MIHWKKLRTAGLYLALFVGLVFFFTQVQPITILDGDDWSFIAGTRLALPLSGEWNPARVLPEILMPWVSSLGVRLFYPILGDYVKALTLSHGLAVSAAILTFLVVMVKVFREKMGASPAAATGAMLFVLLLHFALFKVSASGNVYLFWAADATCYFFYTIPTMLCFAWIGWAELHPAWCQLLEKEHLWEKGLMIASGYLLIYSNLFCSYILALWAGFRMLDSLHRYWGQWLELARQAVLYVFVIVAWLVSLFFEANGDRSKSLAGGSLLQCLPESFSSFWKFRYNTTLVGICVLIALAGCALLWKRRKEKAARTGLGLCLAMATAAGLSWCYLILLCAVTIPGYSSRPDVMLGFFVWCLLVVGAMLSYLLTQIAWTRLALPAVLLVGLSMLAGRDTFAASLTPGVNQPAAYHISTYLVEQLQQADREGKIQVDLERPAGGDVWPFPDYMPQRVVDSLYQHGLLDYRMEITVVRNPELDQRYHLFEW